MGVKKLLRGILKLLRRWLADDDVSPQPAQEFTTLPFDNTYP